MVLTWDQIQPKIMNFPIFNHNFISPKYLPIKDYCIGCDKTVEVKIENHVGVDIVKYAECGKTLEFMYDEDIVD